MTPVPLWIVFLLVAPFVGSFLGVLSMRMTDGRAIAWSRSECDHCAAQLGLADLVPILSWVSLRGRCRHCDANIGAFPLAIELLAFVPVLWAACYMTGTALAVSVAFGWLLLVLSATDWLDYRLPDSLTLTLLLSGLSVAYLLDADNWTSHAIGALAGFMIFFAISIIHQHIRGRTGLGLGDAKLLSGLGAWTGFEGLPSIVLISTLLALVFALGKFFLRENNLQDPKLAFAPFLSLGGWLTWVYGPLILAN